MTTIKDGLLDTVFMRSFAEKCRAYGWEKTLFICDIMDSNRRQHFSDSYLEDRWAEKVRDTKGDPILKALYVLDKDYLENLSAYKAELGPKLAGKSE